MPKKPQFTDLYNVLEVSPLATFDVIRTSYRNKVKTAHPDQGGDPEQFRRLTEAHEVLSDPEKRKRYDETGRTDEGITKAKVDNFLRQMMSNVVNAEYGDGTSDDPVWENILNKVVGSIQQSRREVQNNMHKTQRKIERCQRLIERFKPMQREDIIGDILRDEKKSLEDQLRIHQDAMELSLEAERVLKTYRYETGPGPEGQYDPGPAARLGGPRFLLEPKPPPRRGFFTDN